jgi:peptide deformylase
MTNLLVPSNDSILHKPSAVVDDKEFSNDSAELKPIAALLIKTLYEQQALGVSACQIGIDKSMFVMDVDSKLKVCINPTIVAAVADMALDKEGCLSFPGLHLKVKRPASVIVKYKDIDGREVTEQLEGLEARVWLHEYDHCHGVCFTDRVSKLTLDMAKKKQNKIQKRSTNK